MKKLFYLIAAIALSACSQTKDMQNLYELQQDFVNLRFGMFIHYGMPTYSTEDWPDPDMPTSAFHPTKLDCNQWATAAKSAGMTYGCLTSKHHSGFCIWDTKTTDYNSMESPAKVDVVRQYADAFREQGLKVMLYYSILDTHHRIRKGMIKPEHTDFIKDQLRELLTNYGDIDALIIDGWDAPWSRINYDEIPFSEIYHYIKSIQPNCLVMDLNAAKYPREALYYTDIKSYEQGAGQKISTSENQLPALACLPLQRTWFWKESMPTEAVKDVNWIIKENVEPYNQAYCNFILNVAPNRDGLMDENALTALKEIGRIFNDTITMPQLPEPMQPITQHNMAKNCPTEYTWSYDYGLGDFAVDDDFSKAWASHPSVETPWWQVTLQERTPIDLITILEETAGVIKEYKLEYLNGNKWQTIYEGEADPCRVKQHRFPTVKADAVRITVTRHQGTVKLAEVGVYKAEN